MKKLLAVLLAALLLAVPAFAQTASLAGEWTMTKTVASGVVMSPEAYGLSMTLVLNPDGTAFSQTNHQRCSYGRERDVGAGRQHGHDHQPAHRRGHDAHAPVGRHAAGHGGRRGHVLYADRSRAAGDERARRRAAAGPAALHGRHGSRHGQF